MKEKQDNQPTLTQPNEPLALEQLREMDGEPVWVKQLKGLSVCDTDWAVVEFRLEPDVKHDKIRVWWPGSEDEDTPSEDDYGKTWLAYRRPPEGEEEKSMSSKLRRIFNPTAEEQIQDYKFMLELHREQLGQCSTCANLISGDMSGVVTDYGMCRKNSSLFSAKVCGREDKICSLYVEKSVKSLEQEIDRLRRQSPLEGEEDT